MTIRVLDHYPGATAVKVVNESDYEVTLKRKTAAPKHLKWPPPLENTSYEK